MEDKDFKERLFRDINLLKPLHSPLPPPMKGEWLYEHEEEGQTFEEYLNSDPIIPQGKRRIIYIQPLGAFSDSQREVIDITAQFIGIYYNLPIKIKENITTSNIPSYAQRKHPTWGDFQILTTHVLKKILRPNIPKDAAAYIAFTAEDLWPGKGWNFVFGQASLKNRVGVWSIYRNGDPNKEFSLCLKRTMKTGAHELGHIFSLKHCIQYFCAMNGSNSREEADKRPIVCCPECMAKICWATKTEPIQRYEKLVDFCSEHKFSEQKPLYHQYLSLLISANT